MFFVCAANAFHGRKAPWTTPIPTIQSSEKALAIPGHFITMLGMAPPPPKNRRFPLLAALFLTVFTNASIAADRPNFIIIMADDLGYSDLSCYGNKTYKTPQLDKMAAEGLKFLDFHSSGTVCSPTRAGLMTGRYQQRAGIPAVIVADPKRPTHPHGLQNAENTLPELLKTAGYTTGIFGKWHLGYYLPYNPTHHGFDQFAGYISGNVDFFSHIDQAGRFDWWHDRKPTREKGYTTHLITQHALKFIEANKHRPFCAYIAHEAPHYPYQGPNDKPFRKVGNAKVRAKNADIPRAYREMVQEMDKGVGQILDTLRRLKLDRKTLVFFFSDNGANRHGQNTPLRGFKGQMFEGGHRVPCIVWWPGKIRPASKTVQTAISIDIMPTVLAAAGVSTPKKRPLDGVSLLPVLAQGKRLKPRKLFWEMGANAAVRDGKWKLIIVKNRRKNAKNSVFLFNLDSDLSEKTNLAKKYPDRVKAMRAAHKTWQTDVLANASPQPKNPPK